MLQHLLRRLVFDVPILNEYAKMPLKVCDLAFLAEGNPNYTDCIIYHMNQKDENDIDEALYVCFCPRLAFDQSLRALLEVLLPA